MKGKTGVMRKKEERQRDLAELSRLYIEGWSIRDLSTHFNVSPQIICRDMNDLRKRWLDERRANFNEWIQRELNTLDKVEAEAWDAWEDSKKPRLKTVKSELNNSKSATTQSGNAKFLEIITSTLARRAKLLGYDAPEKRDLTSGGAPIVPVIKFGDEQNGRS